MKVLSRLFGRESKEPSELSKVLMHAAFSGEAGRPITEHEMMESLGINVHMIEDTSLTHFLEELSKERNDKKEIVGFDLDIVALRIMVSKLIRTSYVDPIDAQIAQLETERFITRIEMELDEDTYEYGGTNFLEACGKIISTAWSDSINGRKAKILKVMPKAFEISVPSEAEKKKGGGVF
jgi:hypothetical protein